VMISGGCSCSLVLDYTIGGRLAVQYRCAIRCANGYYTAKAFSYFCPRSIHQCILKMKQQHLPHEIDSPLLSAEMRIRAPQSPRSNSKSCVKARATTPTPSIIFPASSSPSSLFILAAKRLNLSECHLRIAALSRSRVAMLGE